MGKRQWDCLSPVFFILLGLLFSPSAQGFSRVEREDGFGVKRQRLFFLTCVLKSPQSWKASICLFLGSSSVLFRGPSNLGSPALDPFLQQARQDLASLLHQLPAQLRPSQCPSSVSWLLQPQQPGPRGQGPSRCLPPCFLQVQLTPSFFPKVEIELLPTVAFPFLLLLLWAAPESFQSG